MDQRTRELQAPKHPARQVGGTTPSDRPQIDRLEDGPGLSSTSKEEQPVETRDEIDVLADGQLGVHDRELRHVADPPALGARRPGRVDAEDPHGARVG